MTFENLFGDKLSKFRLGQLLFITAITFGLFAGDVIRRSIAVLALLCLSSENFKFPAWTKEQKITGWLLALFCAWMFFIPLIFGEAELSVRTHCATRTFELTLWICVTFLFAKDEFFVNNYKNFAVFFCFLYAVVACVYAVQNHFPFAYSFDSAWPLIITNLNTGAMMCGLSAWVIAAIVTKKSIINLFFSTVTLLLTTILTICSSVTTFWIALFAEYIIAIFFLFLYKKRAAILFILCTIVVYGIIFVSLNYAMKKNPVVNQAIRQQICQLTAIKSNNIEGFTTHRNIIWADAVRIIPQKPIFGYGHETFIKYSTPVDGNTFPHAHNTFLNTAVIAGLPAALLFYAFLFMLVFLAVKMCAKRKALSLCPFVTLLMLTTFLIAGLVEGMLCFPERFRVIMYITLFVTMLNLYNTDNTHV